MKKENKRKYTTIIKELDLRKPIYYETSQWGAYGNGFNWDKE